MPRLSTDTYLWRHDFLSCIWENDRRLFALLSPTQQRELHRYYLPSTDLTLDQLGQHRRHLDQSEPSLGARAGKHYAVLHETFNHICDTYGLDTVLTGSAVPDYVASHPRRTVRYEPAHGSTRIFSVAAVAKPEPNGKLLAQALLRLADQLTTQNQPTDVAPDEQAAA
jgi:hypothetical protein